MLFMILTQYLLQTTAKRNAAHGVQQKIDSEMRIVEQYEESLQTLECLRCSDVKKNTHRRITWLKQTDNLTHDTISVQIDFAKKIT
ncbi:unnamed protein product [Lasius platythorax]|uniref:Uncharacterized protein n=1 Tax=Lasius platythorax TaxID=488582 RepID=A0AAV2MWQ3_9HYME